MWIFAVLCFIIVLLWNKSQNIDNIVAHEVFVTKSCYFIMSLFVAIVFFHSPDLQADAYDYKVYYMNMDSMSFSQLLEEKLDYYCFFWLCKLFSLSGLSYHFWFAFVQIMYLLSIWLIVKKESSDKILSLLLYLTLGLFAFSLQGLKQVTGMTAMLFAYSCVLNKKYFFALPCVFFAFNSHGSCMMFLPALFLPFVSEKKYYIILVISMIGFFFLSSTSFMAYLVEASGKERYESYLEADNVYTAVSLIYFIVLWILAFFGYRHYSLANKAQANLYYGLSAIAVAFQSFATSHSFYFRIAMLYLPFFMLLLPNATDQLKRKDIKWLLISVVVFYCLYTSRNVSISFGLD